jgi:hypothetical protein
MKFLNQIIFETESRPESISALNRRLDAHYSGLSQADSGHLRDYSVKSEHFNSYLWERHNDHKKTENADHEEAAENLNRIIDSHSAPETFNTYSGVKANPHTYAKNGIIHQPAFLSSSTNPKKAVGFAKHHIFEAGNRESKRDTEGNHITTFHHHILKHVVNEGDPGIFMSKYSYAPEECEYLKGSGISYKLGKTTSIIKPSKDKMIKHAFHFHEIKAINQ